MFAVSVYALIDASSEDGQKNFYRGFSRLHRSAKTTDIVILAGEMNSQVIRLTVAEGRLGERSYVIAQHTDNGDRLL